ncbi:methionine--tRNA ligase [Candidatus Pacearchaeota archaeon]|nr:methionine--tRNA ligase [Candidatus Pacearchaeota archaeon]|tara:strand:+ start:5353 stop:7077 length:1725 start_codon:yes stop_codon:yes gene_type:complete
MSTNLEKMVKTGPKKGKRLITAALPYVNNIPHLGHMVGSHLPADVFARYSRSKGYETLFVGGSDENGTPCGLAAEKVGVPIGTFLDTLYGKHKDIYNWFGISYDNFSRTSKPVHNETVQDFFNVLDKKGLIKKGSMKVFYSPEEDRFLPGRYVSGECPKCGYDEANGDQCESCTGVLTASELKNPRSVISGGAIEIRDSEHLFLDFEKLTTDLRKWVGKQKQWRSQVKGIANGWLDEGLRDRCITRDLKHGVPVPVDGFEDKVFYVWFDAPIGYISATKEATPDWKDFWTGESEVFNFLGKDNIPFHTIFWPGMIIGGEEFNLPKNVLGLNYLNYEGKKFSKSKGVGVFCERLPELGLPADMWRAYLSQIIPESGDTEFKWDEFQERVNSDLIGNYGNYTNRIVKFTNTKLGGELERPTPERVLPKDREFLDEIKRQKEEIEESLERADIRKAYHGVMELSSMGNRYLHDQAPWVTIKEDPERANDVMYHGALLLKTLATVSAPFIPDTAEKVWDQLNLSGSPLAKGAWDTATDPLDKKHKVGEPQLLFEGLDDKRVEEYKEKASKATDLAGFF